MFAQKANCRLSKVVSVCNYVTGHVFVVDVSDKPYVKASRRFYKHQSLYCFQGNKLTDIHYVIRGDDLIQYIEQFLFVSIFFTSENIFAFRQAREGA